MKKHITTLALALSCLSCLSALAAPASPGTYTGTKKGLIILVEFPKRTATGTPAVAFSTADARAFYERVANEENFSDPATGFTQSVRDYFYAQSDGQLEFSFQVVGPYRLGNTYNYYGADEDGVQDVHLGQLVYDACRKADGDVDFSQFDADGDGKVDLIYILYAGQGQNVNNEDTGLLWPQEGSLNALGSDQAPFVMDGVTIESYAVSNELGVDGALDGIGTMCHEFSHTLGLPDMYDKGTSFGETTLKYGTYVWDLMNVGNYLGNGFTPAGYTAFERMYCGWRQPVELKADTVVTAMKPLSEGGETYIIYNDGDRNEYFLLENRQQTGIDSCLYASGLMITHVDYSEEAWTANNVNTTKERCFIVPADNSTERIIDDVCGDLYPYNGNTAFGNTTVPAATLINANSDGSYLLNKEVTDITQHADGTISFAFHNANASTGIRDAIAEEGHADGVYSIDGKYLGTSADGLPHGVYIMGGKKIVR